MENNQGYLCAFVDSTAVHLCTWLGFSRQKAAWGFPSQHLTGASLSSSVFLVCLFVWFFKLRSGKTEHISNIFTDVSWRLYPHSWTHTYLRWRMRVSVHSWMPYSGQKHIGLMKDCVDTQTRVLMEIRNIHFNSHLCPVQSLTHTCCTHAYTYVVKMFLHLK